MRRHILKSENETINGIRVRGVEVTRLEGLTDAVIGFAITLLIVSMEVPNTFDEMYAMVLGFPAFGITFLLLVAIWYWHYRFFRQFGLNNKGIVWANGILLFVVLLFVYPLKFLATVVVNTVILKGWFGFDMPNQLSIDLEQFAYLHALYATGFSAVFFCFTWFYKLALNAKDTLELNELEELWTRQHMVAFSIVAIIPLLTILLLALPTPFAAMWAGFANMLIWPATWLYGIHADKQVTALKVKLGVK